MTEEVIITENDILIGDIKGEKGDTGENLTVQIVETLPPINEANNNVIYALLKDEVKPANETPAEDEEIYEEARG